MPSKSSTKSKSTSKASSKASSKKTPKEPETKTPAAKDDTAGKLPSAEPTIVIPDTAQVINESDSQQPTDTSSADAGQSAESTDAPQTPKEAASTPDDTLQTGESAAESAPENSSGEEQVIDQPVPDIVENPDFVAEEKSGGKKLLIVFVIALLIGGGAVAGFFYFFNPYKQTPESEKQSADAVEESTDETPTPELEEEIVATDSAEPEEVDLSTLSVQILNGSGTAGEAGVVNELLKAEGFELFELGNASSYDYTATDVQIKEGTALEVFETIKDALTADGYTIAEDDALSEDNEYDVIIVVGTK